MKKGLELPINMIVVIAIAVLVLVVVAAVFSGYFITNTNTIGVEQAWNKACQNVRLNNCVALDGSVSYQRPGTSDTSISIRELCELKLDISQSQTDFTKQCLKACGCAVPTP